MNNNFPYDHHGISGSISVKLQAGRKLDDFFLNILPTFDRKRFEILAIRIFSGRENIITLYALDKTLLKREREINGKLPVKKIKLYGLNIQDLFNFFDSYNLTISTGKYDLKEILITNR